MVHQPSPSDEVVKVVVVGDPGVGKTCLICSWACDAHYELRNLVKTHVATVWAIDHYQRDRDVMEKSWCEVDGIQVSLRLWDTFGYHDKDRAFAYKGRNKWIDVKADKSLHRPLFSVERLVPSFMFANRFFLCLGVKPSLSADVVLLCFSTVCPGSLRNVKAVWLPEIQRFCPSTPIILAGTQADLRYLYNDLAYLSVQKGMMYRRIFDKDIVTPAMGRETARDINSPYYETSVLTKFGVDDVFVNCARAALIERRKLKFWSTQLRRVQRPFPQKPMPLPLPTMPQIVVPNHQATCNLAPLLYEQYECDVVLRAQETCFEAHRVVLAVSSKIFKDLFSSRELLNLSARYRSSSQLDGLQEISLANIAATRNGDSLPKSRGDSSITPEAPGTPRALSSSEGESPSPTPVENVNTRQYPLLVSYSHPAFASVEVKFHSDPFNPAQSSLMTFVTLHPDITSRAFHWVLEFLYTGHICEVTDQGSVNELQRAAELLGLSSLLKGLDNRKLPDGEFLNAQLKKQIQKAKFHRLRNLSLSSDGFLTDVIFQVEDGLVSAHRVLLMAGCEMMHAMFSNHFLEYSVDVIPFYGINCNTFRTLMEYIYTGETTSIGSADGLSLIVIANQLCLPHLVCKTEAFVASELQRMADPIEETIMLIEPSKLHNAKQLAQWCEKFLSVRYQEVVQQHYKLFRNLPKDIQENIERQQWPPVWYLQEMEYYDQQTGDYLMNQKQKDRQDNSRGCFCFSRRPHHQLDHPA